jgi:hypothetical protein
MKNDHITMHRKDMKIEGDRDLYSYTFTDSDGKVIEPEPTLPPVPLPEASAKADDKKPGR